MFGASGTGRTEALKKSGALAGSNRLRPASTATTVRIADGKSQVLDGPYADFNNPEGYRE